MAWKLRKDRLQAGTPQEETDAVETTPETPTLAEETMPLPAFQDEVAPAHPFLLPDAEPSGPTPASPHFAPYDFSTSAFQTEPIPVSEPDFHAGVEEEEPLFSPMHTSGHNAFVIPEEAPAFHSDAPVFAEEPPTSPFAPFQPQRTESLPTGPTDSALDLASPFVMPEPEAPATRPDVDREEIASSLVTQGTDTGIPRVAPFIVDVPPTEEAPAVTGTLIVRMGKLSAAYPIIKDQTVIGRPDSAVESYPDLEIDLDDAVSRRHAEIRRHDDGYFVVDTMSTNGTRLNGEMLQVYKEYPLAHGDRIRIGDRTEIVFE